MSRQWCEKDVRFTFGTRTFPACTVEFQHFNEVQTGTGLEKKERVLKTLWRSTPWKPKLWHFMLRGVCNAKIATGVRKERVSCYPLWHCCPSSRSVSTYLRDDLWNWEVSFDIHLELLAPTCSHLWPASTCSLSLRQRTWGSLFMSTTRGASYWWRLL